MGAKKKRQGHCWHDQQKPSVCIEESRTSVLTNSPGASASPINAHFSNLDQQCTSCLKNSNNFINSDHYSAMNSDELNNPLPCSRVKSYLFTKDSQQCLLKNKGQMRGVGFIKCRESSLSSSSLLRSVVILLIVASSNLFISPVESVCVWQGGGGFRVACGFRQSGLFRLRSIGGIKGYVGAGFTIGDETGFKDSLTNTEHHQPQPQSGVYVIPNNVHSQRSLSSGPIPIGQFSQIQEHAIPLPTGHPAVQQQQRMQYLQTLEDQMDLDHQGLQMVAADQRNQKLLEQQMYAQGGLIPAIPTSKVKRAGGLTKRASLWNWPSIFGRGNNGKNGKKKDRSGNRRGGPPPPPPQAQHQHPPHGNKHGGQGRWDNRHPHGKPQQPRRDERRRGPGGKFPPASDSFIGHMKNPFSHLQDNFVGKPNNENRRIHNIPQTGPQQRHHPMPSGSSMEANRNNVPNQFMMPPAGLPMETLPKFKKIPSNLQPKQTTEEMIEEEAELENQQQHPPVNRMMHDGGNSEGIEKENNFYNSPTYDTANDPAGLKMLKRTENFGTVFHLVNPDGTPVDMQFEKQPIYPPGVEPYPVPLQGQDPALGLGSNLAMINTGLPLHNPDQPISGDMLTGGGELDSPLATAVYDPNVFPDIYFTTTEKLKDSQQEMNLLGSGGYLSQELLENPMMYGLGGNQIKRILSTASSEKHENKKLRSGEAADVADTPVDAEIVVTRRKMRRRKKLRTNQLDTTAENETDVEAGATPTSSPKKRRKGRRKKYKLKLSIDTEGFSGSTERMGLAAVDGEQVSTEAQTEPPSPNPLTTTSAPQNLDISSDENKVMKSNEKSGENNSKEKKNSFSFPSVEDLRAPVLASLEVSQGLSNENNVDTMSKQTTTTHRTTSEETTTKQPNFSPFLYNEALQNKDQFSSDDYDFFASGPSGPGDYYKSSYDPRYPPDHEINRGHNMTKFIRPRGPSSGTTTTTTPFILYDMVGTRNQSRFSSKFKLDGDKNEPNRSGDPYTKLHNNEHSHYANSNTNIHGIVGASAHQQQHSKEYGKPPNDKGVYLKFDSNEWHGSGSFHGHSATQYEKELSSAQMSNHYNKTSFNSGYYGVSGPSKEYNPSAEQIPWERKYNGAVTTQAPHPMYPGASSSLEHGLFGSAKHSFGAQRQTPSPLDIASGENKQRKLHKNLFGGSSADVSDLGNWASPNFWNNEKQADRYSPSSDFETQNNNLKRLLNYDSANGLKEISPGDLSSPTPIPMPSPSPVINTLEDLLDSSDYFLSPSTPGSRWGKPRRRKGRPTTAVPATTPGPMKISAVPTLMASPTSPPAKWLAVMSNEVDIPQEFYNNLHAHPPGPSSLEKSGGKSGIEIKFKSGEERDPEEEENNERNVTAASSSSHFDILSGFPTGTTGFNGVMVHNFDTTQGYGFGDPVPKNNQNHHHHSPPPGNSDLSFFNSDSGNMKMFATEEGPSIPSFFGPMHPPPPGLTKPVFPGSHQSNSRRDFIPSAEDLGPLPPLPPHSTGGGGGHGSGPGLPVHSDNPFKVLEKQSLPVNSGFGFVSTDHEVKAMENQISKFSNNNHFLRRDSSEKVADNHHQHHDEHPIMDHPEFNGPPPPPASPPRGPPDGPHNEMNFPGFATIPLPEPSAHPDMTAGGIPPSPLSEFGPSGFPNSLRDPEKESAPPSGPNPSTRDGPPPPPHGHLNSPEQETHWSFNPLDHNDVELGPMSQGGRPPMSGRGPPLESESDEGFRQGPPPHMRNGPSSGPGGPPGHPRYEHDPPRGPPPSMRDDPFGPPPREHDRPPMPHPNRHPDSFPRGPPGPPGPRRENDQVRPNFPEFDRDFPPRGEHGPPPHHPDDRFRDGPGRGPPPNKPPQPPRNHDSRQPHGGPLFHPPHQNDDHFRYEHDRKPFHESHKPIENLRPPPKSKQENRGDHTTFTNWQAGKEMRDRFPHPPHSGPPKHPEQRPPPPPPSHYKEHGHNKPPPPPSHGPYAHKNYPPPPPGKKPLPPHHTKIPPQSFKPPHPPPKSQGPMNYFKNILLTGPFGKPAPNKKHPPMMPPPPPPRSNNPPKHGQNNNNNRGHPPPPNHPPTTKKPIHHPPPPPPPPKSNSGPDNYYPKMPFREPPPRDYDNHHHNHPPPHKNNPNNYINPFNDRYEPPPPHHHSPPKNKDYPETKYNTQSRPPPLPSLLEQSGSRLPFLPFPTGPQGNDFETSFIDLDKDPHAHMIPPKLAPLPPTAPVLDPSLPVRDMQSPFPPSQPHNKFPVYQPKPNSEQKKVDEKNKVLEAFKTLNNANVDVIQSLAADQYGPDFMDRLKTKTNMMKESFPKPPHFPLKVEPMPVVTSTSSYPKPLLNVIASVTTTKRPAVQAETNKLTALLNLINNRKHSIEGGGPSLLQPIAQESVLGSSNHGKDALSSLFQNMSSTVPSRLAELPSSPGLVSLTSLHQPHPHDIKSLQAQIAKAIIAKAQRKQDGQIQPQQQKIEPISTNTSQSPISVLQQLAQNRMDHSGKNYTATQIQTLKKLIALNNIEQKLQSTIPPATAAPAVEDPLKKLQELLPAALSAAKKRLPDALPTQTLSRKMLDSSTASSNFHHHSHSSNTNLLQEPDPTILALKAIALSKAQGVNPQPSISLPQQVKPTEPSSQPIAVDLSAILSPSPPVVEVARTRRLINVRNAPKSFYPANATLGFEDSTLPLLSDFHCEDQSFFPGLYADTKLGCRVFHLCAKTDAGYMLKSFRCPKETVFDQEVLRCNWNLFVECPTSQEKYHFNKYLSQSFQFLKILGEFSAKIQNSDATMTG